MGKVSMMCAVLGVAAAVTCAVSLQLLMSLDMIGFAPLAIFSGVTTLALGVGVIVNWEDGE